MDLIRSEGVLGSLLTYKEWLEENLNENNDREEDMIASRLRKKRGKEQENKNGSRRQRNMQSETSTTTINHPQKEEKLNTEEGYIGRNNLKSKTGVFSGQSTYVNRSQNLENSTHQKRQPETRENDIERMSTDESITLIGYRETEGEEYKNKENEEKYRLLLEKIRKRGFEPKTLGDVLKSRKKEWAKTQCIHSSAKEDFLRHLKMYKNQFRNYNRTPDGWIPRNYGAKFNKEMNKEGNERQRRYQRSKEEEKQKDGMTWSSIIFCPNLKPGGEIVHRFSRKSMKTYNTLYNTIKKGWVHPNLLVCLIRDATHPVRFATPPDQDCYTAIYTGPEIGEGQNTRVIFGEYTGIVYREDSIPDSIFEYAFELNFTSASWFDAELEYRNDKQYIRDLNGTIFLPNTSKYVLDSSQAFNELSMVNHCQSIGAYGGEYFLQANCEWQQVIFDGWPHVILTNKQGVKIQTGDELIADFGALWFQKVEENCHRQLKRELIQYRLFHTNNYNNNHINNMDSNNNNSNNNVNNTENNDGSDNWVNNNKDNTKNENSKDNKNKSPTSRGNNKKVTKDTGTSKNKGASNQDGNANKGASSRRGSNFEVGLELGTAEKDGKEVRRKDEGVREREERERREKFELLRQELPEEKKLDNLDYCVVNNNTSYVCAICLDEDLNSNPNTSTKKLLQQRQPSNKQEEEGSYRDDEDEDECIVCDGCDRIFHTKCLQDVTDTALNYIQLDVYGARFINLKTYLNSQRNGGPNSRARGQIGEENKEGEKRSKIDLSLRKWYCMYCRYLCKQIIQHDLNQDFMPMQSCIYITKQESKKTEEQNGSNVSTVESDNIYNNNNNSNDNNNDMNNNDGNSTDKVCTCTCNANNKDKETVAEIGEIKEGENEDCDPDEGKKQETEDKGEVDEIRGITEEIELYTETELESEYREDSKDSENEGGNDDSDDDKIINLNKITNYISKLTSFNIKDNSTHEPLKGDGAKDKEKDKKKDDEYNELKEDEQVENIEDKSEDKRKMIKVRGRGIRKNRRPGCRKQLLTLTTSYRKKKRNMEKLLMKKKTDYKGSRNERMQRMKVITKPTTLEIAKHLIRQKILSLNTDKVNVGRIRMFGNYTTMTPFLEEEMGDKKTFNINLFNLGLSQNDLGGVSAKLNENPREDKGKVIELGMCKGVEIDSLGDSSQRVMDITEDFKQYTYNSFNNFNDNNDDNSSSNTSFKERRKMSKDGSLTPCTPSNSVRSSDQSDMLNGTSSSESVSDKSREGKRGRKESKEREDKREPRSPTTRSLSRKSQETNGVRSGSQDKSKRGRKPSLKEGDKNDDGEVEDEKEDVSSKELDQKVPEDKMNNFNVKGYKENLSNGNLERDGTVDNLKKENDSLYSDNNSPKNEILNKNNMNHFKGLSIDRREELYDSSLMGNVVDYLNCRYLAGMWQLEPFAVFGEAVRVCVECNRKCGPKANVYVCRILKRHLGGNFDHPKATNQEQMRELVLIAYEQHVSFLLRLLVLKNVTIDFLVKLVLHFISHPFYQAHSPKMGINPMTPKFTFHQTSSQQKVESILTSTSTQSYNRVNSVREEKEKTPPQLKSQGSLAESNTSSLRSGKVRRVNVTSEEEEEYGKWEVEESSVVPRTPTVRGTKNGYSVVNSLRKEDELKITSIRGKDMNLFITNYMPSNSISTPVNANNSINNNNNISGVLTENERKKEEKIGIWDQEEDEEEERGVKGRRVRSNRRKDSKKKDKGRDRLSLQITEFVRAITCNMKKVPQGDGPFNFALLESLGGLEKDFVRMVNCGDICSYINDLSSYMCFNSDQVPSTIQQILSKDEMIRFSHFRKHLLKEPGFFNPVPPSLYSNSPFSQYLNPENNSHNGYGTTATYSSAREQSRVEKVDRRFKKRKEDEDEEEFIPLLGIKPGKSILYRKFSDGYYQGIVTNYGHYNYFKIEYSDGDDELMDPHDLLGELIVNLNNVKSILLQLSSNDIRNYQYLLVLRSQNLTTSGGRDKLDQLCTQLKSNMINQLIHSKLNTSKKFKRK